MIATGTGGIAAGDDGGSPPPRREGPHPLARPPYPEGRLISRKSSPMRKIITDLLALSRQVCYNGIVE